MAVQTKGKNDFTQGSMAKNILNMAIPMMLAQVVNVLYSVVDRIYIGRMPGAGALALTGVGVAAPILSMVAAFTHLFGSGGAPLCSIARGKGDLDRAEKIMGNSFSLLMITGVILMIVTLIIKRPVLYLFGASDATIEYANSYITIYMFGTLFVMAGLGMNSFINAQGFGRMGMITVLVGAVANLVLDPVFIFLLDMGVAGAALATVISQFLSALWVMRFLTGKKAILKLRVKNMHLDRKIVGQITGLGLAGFTMAFTNSGVTVVTNSMLQAFGGDLYVGVMTIINSVREMTFMAVSGFTGGSQPVLGYNYGAGRGDRVKKGIKFLTTVCVVYTFVVWVVLMLRPEMLMKLFTSDTAVLEAGRTSIRIYFFGYYLMALQMAGQSVFTALGKSKQAVFFSLLRKAFIVIPLSLILPRLWNLGVNGVFLAEPISDLIGGCASYGVMILTVWRTLEKKEE